MVFVLEKLKTLSKTLNFETLAPIKKQVKIYIKHFKAIFCVSYKFFRENLDEKEIFNFKWYF